MIKIAPNFINKLNELRVLNPAFNKIANARLMLVARVADKQRSTTFGVIGLLSFSALGTLATHLDLFQCASLARILKCTVDEASCGSSSTFPLYSGHDN